MRERTVGQLASSYFASPSHVDTPPWCEQVPRRVFDIEYVPSLHCALAPAGLAVVVRGAASRGMGRAAVVGAGMGIGADAGAGLAVRGWYVIGPAFAARSAFFEISFVAFLSTPP